MTGPGPMSTCRTDSSCARRKKTTRPITSTASPSDKAKTNGGDSRPSPANIDIPNVRRTRISRTCVGSPEHMMTSTMAPTRSRGSTGRETGR